MEFYFDLFHTVKVEYIQFYPMVYYLDKISWRYIPRSYPTVYGLFWEPWDDSTNSSLQYMEIIQGGGCYFGLVYLNF